MDSNLAVLAESVVLAAPITNAITNSYEAAKTSTLGFQSKGAQEETDYREKYAVASGISYVYNKGGYKAAQALADKLLPGYTVKPEYSSDDHVSLVNDRSKNVIVSYRGTDPNNLDDLKADWHIVNSGNDLSGRPRFEKASSDFDTVRMAMGGKYTYQVTGHSLGGTQAMFVARRHPDVKAFVYNPGVTTPTPSQAFGALASGASMWDKRMGQNSADLNNVEILRIDGDVVSHGAWRTAGLQGINGQNGSRLVNLTYANEPGKLLATTLRKHELANFMTPQTAIVFRQAAELSEDQFVYGPDPTNPDTHYDDPSSTSEQTLANLAVGSHGEIHHHTRRGNSALDDMRANAKRESVRDKATAWAKATGGDPGDYWYHLHNTPGEAADHIDNPAAPTREKMFNAAVSTANGPVLELAVPQGFASGAPNARVSSGSSKRGNIHMYDAGYAAEDHRVASAPALRQVPSVHKAGGFAQPSAARVDHVHTMAPVTRAPQGSQSGVTYHHARVRDNPVM